MKLSKLYKAATILTFATIDLVGFFFCVFTIAGYFGRYGWHFDIFSNFRAVYLGYFLLCLMVSIKRPHMLLVTWICFALVNVIPILHLYIPESAQCSGQPKLKMMTVNLEAIENHHFDKAVACIKEFDPDIISIQEIDNEFATYLKKSLPEYAYAKLLPNPGFSGVGLLSKYPIASSQVYNFGRNFPVIASKVKTPLGIILVIVMHPVPPITPFFWSNESIFTDGVAQLCRATRGSIVLAGDLNATSFSYQYRKLLKLTNLRDSNQGFGYQSTWHADLPMIDIDHCFMSKDLVAVVRRVGRNILSDHLPLYIEITKAK